MSHYTSQFQKKVTEYTITINILKNVLHIYTDSDTEIAVSLFDQSVLEIVTECTIIIII